MTRRRIAFAAAAITAAALLVNTAPADATPQQDGTFLYTIGRYGINYSDAGGAVAAAHVVCAELAGGATPEDIAASIHQGSGLSLQSATNFTAASILVYCPWQQRTAI